MKIFVPPGGNGKRLDQFLASNLENVSRARVQELISSGNILINEMPAKAAARLRGGETITVVGNTQRAPLKAMAQEIPLEIVYEDDDLAVINKPAGMMVHAGAGASDDARNRLTLVNALLHHLKSLSSVSGALRPGIVHRLDKDTSGLIVVAKNDEAHRRLGAQFAAREVTKRYIALVHGWVKQDSGTIDASIGRDRVRRTRMTTRGRGGRSAVTHYRLLRRIESAFGKFALVELKIDTGRTHQIRVHMSALGHPVVGDTVYGAPRELRLNPVSAKMRASKKSVVKLSLPRNFLHAAKLVFRHPRSASIVSRSAELPVELREFLEAIERARPEGLKEVSS